MENTIKLTEYLSARLHGATIDFDRHFDAIQQLCREGIRLKSNYTMYNGLNVYVHIYDCDISDEIGVCFHYIMMQRGKGDVFMSNGLFDLNMADTNYSYNGTASLFHCVKYVREQWFEVIQ